MRVLVYAGVEVFCGLMRKVTVKVQAISSHVPMCPAPDAVSSTQPVTDRLTQLSGNAG